MFSRGNYGPLGIGVAIGNFAPPPFPIARPVVPPHPGTMFPGTDSSIYRAGGADARRLFGRDERAAARYYRQYLRFVTTHATEGAQVLDLGCGSGWSSWLLARRGFGVTGIDVDPHAFEPDAGPGLDFAAASLMQLPFRDDSFDVVASYQVLEHVRDPAEALLEMGRVTRPGGVVIVAGPNLLSPLNSLRQIAKGCWRNRPLTSIFVRRPQDPRLPFGHTLPEALLALLRNTCHLASRALVSPTSPSPRPFPRWEPDLRPPARGDRDACNLLNPMDVATHFRTRHWEVIAVAFPGRAPWTAPLAGGTWVAVRKPRAEAHRA